MNRTVRIVLPAAFSLLLALGVLHIAQSDTESHSTASVPAANSNDTQIYPVGNQPSGIAFDGTNMWIANRGDNTVSVLRASDGFKVMTVPVGTAPDAVAFDGTNIWVANALSNTINVIRASDGYFVMTPTATLGDGHAYMAYDGTNMWIASEVRDTINVIRASDGAHVLTPTVGSISDIVFDGHHMWIEQPYVLSALDVSTGNVITTTFAGDMTTWHSLAFDGNNLRVGVAHPTKYGPLNGVGTIRASDGQLRYVLALSVQGWPTAISSDGMNMWTFVGWPGDAVGVYRISDEALIARLSVSYVFEFAYDGTYMWGTDSYGGVVTKIALPSPRAYFPMVTK